MKVLVAHVIITAYGFWLPNDPRGSWSEFVGAWELLKYGRATKVTTRQSVAGVAHDRKLRIAAKQSLKYKPVRFTGVQARAIGRGFGQAVEEGGYSIHACSVLHDHVHLVIGKHLRFYEQIVGHLKGRASQQLRAEGFIRSSRTSARMVRYRVRGLEDCGRSIAMIRITFVARSITSREIRCANDFDRSVGDSSPRTYSNRVRRTPLPAIGVGKAD